MASTRNKNHLGNYQLETKETNSLIDYRLYDTFGKQDTIYHPGDGLMGAKMSRTQLSSNSCDVESELFGIGSSNLVNPRSKVSPDLIQLKSLAIIDKPKQIIVEPVKIVKNNRPMFLN